MDREQTDAEQTVQKCSVHVNEQIVTLTGEQHRPADIKRAAIEQSVAIEEDFVLSIEYEPQKTRIVAEEEVIVVEAGACFVAVAPDDAS